MPYELIWEDRGVVSRYWGDVTYDELVQTNLERNLDPSFERSEYDLAIFSESVVFKLSASNLRALAASDAGASKRNPNFLVAIVGTKSVIRGLSNLYRIQHEAMGGLWKMKYFETEAEARRWISETLD